MFALVAAVAVCALIAVYFMRLIMKRRKPLTPWAEARKALELLSVPATLNESTGKVFYTRLVDVIKKYIHRRYGYDIEGKTDREIINCLGQHVSFPRDLLPVLSDILDHGLHVKFARELGVAEHMKADVELGLRLVKDTTPPDNA